MAPVRWPAQPVTVRVPATSANLGPGFDSLALALSLHDLVQARATSSGLSVEVNGIGHADLPRDERHLVVRAMRAAFDAVGGQPPGLALRCENAIPHGFGFGSSAAAIVAGLLAARALTGERGAERLPDQAVLGLAAEIEGHADNVAACLRGGLTIAWTAGPAGPVRCARFDPLPGLKAVLCVPAVPLATEVARAALPEVVPHADAAANAARAALLVGALTRASGSLAASVLLNATEDFLHQRYRAATMPGTAELLAALRGAGIPAVVSGAGPAVLALIAPGVAAGPDAVAAIADDSGRAWTVRPLDIDLDGAITTL